MQRNLSAAPDFKIVSSIVISQLSMMFSVNVVMSFMPFYIIRVSTYTPQETILWTGFIMGLTAFVGAIASPFWGSLAAKMNTKALYQWPFLLNAVLFLLMGFVDNLPMLLVLRLIQGGLLGASTIGLFIISAVSPREKLAGNLSLIQNTVTAGQLLGPPVGAYLAAHLGYRSPFVFSFAFLSISWLLCHYYVPEIGKQEKTDNKREPFWNRSVLWGAALICIATIQLNFLPTILPHVMGEFEVVGVSALKVAGFIMMGYTVTAIIGSYAISRLTTKTKIVGTIVGVCLIAALLQALLIVSPGLISFTTIRMLQTGVIASVIPLVMTNLTSVSGGAQIGILNGARFAGNAAGPLMATSVLAVSNLCTLYFLISVLTVFAVLAFWLTTARDRKH